MTIERDFAVDGHAAVDVTSFAGDVTIAVVDRPRISVRIDAAEDRFHISQRGNLVSIEPVTGGWRRFVGSDIDIEVPLGTNVTVRASAGDTRSNGKLGTVEITSSSGDVRLEDCMGDLVIRSASGDIYGAAVGGRLSVTTASGDARLGDVVGDAEITTASGNVWLGAVGGEIRFRSASGDFSAQRVAGRSVRGRTMSGDIDLGIPPRRTVEFDLHSLSGELRNDLDAGGEAPEATIRLRITSVSGDVRLFTV